MALRKTVYTNRDKCDWCHEPIDQLHGRGCAPVRDKHGIYGQPAYDDRYVPNMVKFISPIDGNYVRARFCPDHLTKVRNLMEYPQ